MSATTPKLRAPVVDPNGIEEIADDIWVIPDADHTLLVPNVGIIVGSRATLVIDTGFGPDNARRVVEQARRLSQGRPIDLTHTHCHPEHGFGANVIAGEVTIVYNETQWVELQEKGPRLLQMFRKQLAPLAPMLVGVEFVAPDFRYTGSLTLDLGGGQIVELREFGGAHSRGDQAVIVQRPGPILFTGDLIEEGYFGILGDNESHVIPWIDRLDRFQLLDPAIVVPGHGHVNGPGLIPTYRGYFELARRRVSELRAADELTEAEIVEQVIAEVLELHPDWQNRNWVKQTVSDFSWPARA
jgi:glyoxylase-like metal-dependent hydrolase (beta-lactamase superfamily II)